MKRMTIIAAAILMLAAGNEAQAQLGGALNRARRAVEQTTQRNARQATQEAAGQAVQQAAAPAGQQGFPATYDELNNESRPRLAKWVMENPTPFQQILIDDLDKREAIASTYEYCLARSHYLTPEQAELILALMNRSADGFKLFDGPYPERGFFNFVSDLKNVDADSLEVFKMALEARHADNLAIAASPLNDEIIGDFTGTIPPAYRQVKREIELYGDLMEAGASRLKMNNVDITVSNGMATVNNLSLGRYRFGWQDGKEAWFLPSGDPKIPPTLRPVDEPLYSDTRKLYANIDRLLWQPEPREQLPAREIAQLASDFMRNAQMNSLGMVELASVPSPQMNDAALTAKMLAGAQAAYPKMNIVKVVIAESAWRPETNALGLIIHRRINTKIVCKPGEMYLLRTLSFIEPYTGDGYGEVRPFAIGTDDIPVDYKP